MNEQLKKCPFCGGEGETFQDEEQTRYKWAIRCENLCVEMPNEIEAWFTSESNAIKAWNIRV